MVLVLAKMSSLGFNVADESKKEEVVDPSTLFIPKSSEPSF